MKLNELIKQRVSIGKFLDKKVPTELVINLLDDAVYAPNHKMREPWRFIILENEGKDLFVHRYLSELTDDQQNEIKPMLLKVFSAPMVIAVAMPTLKDMRDELEDLQANAAMIQNFLLLATEHNLATFWKTPKYIETDKFKEVLGIQLNEIVVSLIMIGYSDQVQLPKKRKSAKDLTSIYK
ncbi:MAG: nitroreductase [Acholeplasmataceae bacterium]|jgi:nitroreductase|nr:nitroreductase [Acholeplasmataceae bacterium]